VSAFRVDSVIASSLQIIANSNTGIPATYARNILIAAGKITYQEPILLSDTSLKKSKKIKFRGVQEKGDVSVLSVYPNPARDFFVVKILPGLYTGNGKINMFDGKGILIWSHPVVIKQDQIIMPIINLKKGLYLLVLEINEIWIESTKIAILN
jgi:hypothetical protein